MSRKTPLDCQSKKVFLVIRKNKEIPIESIRHYCNVYMQEWTFIEHKKDINPDDGTIEGVHYHIVGVFRDSRVRFAQRLNEIVKFFGFENPFGIEIEKYENYALSLQYLIHKGFPSKTQHSVDELHTNIAKEELNTYLSMDVGHIIDFNYINQVCKRSHNKRDLIKELGFNIYHKYRTTILDIYEEWRIEREKI